ncbi:MAG: FG-GAP repeat domain-containing protein [Armatimonadota bacterium]
MLRRVPAIVALLLPAAVLVAQPTNVDLVNPAFDQGVTDDGVPIGWSPYGSRGEGTAMRVVVTGEGGGHALLLEDASTASEIGVYQDFPATGGEAYRVVVSAARVPGAMPQGMNLQLRFLPSNVYRQVAVAPASEDFTQTEVYLVAPADTTTGRIYLYTHAEPTPKVMVTAVSVTAGAELPPFPQGPAPAPVPPQYDRLKELHLTTPLVRGGQPAISIVAPASGRYDAPARAIQAAIREISGVQVPIITDEAPEAAVPLQGHLIVLGNRSTNRTLHGLYERFFTLLDLKYPGSGGYAVHSLHNPFGDGHNAILVGGSDDAGVADAAQALIALLRQAGGGRGELAVGWLHQVRLSERYQVPRDPEELEIWEASVRYGSSGYFGWNMISKHMAAYYMTGDEYHAREFLRLSFPDEAAIREIEQKDGELIENKHDPLAGPYHYGAHMMILFWDLIEESPIFTDEQRLAVTNALSRQLTHRAVEGVYGRATPPDFVGGRHGDWSATSLWVLARYFQRDYPDPIWQTALRSAEIYFSAIENSAWFAGMNDHLFWYTSYYDPMLDYMIMSGYRGGMDNLRQALKTQDILFTGTEDDWGLATSSLNFLHRAAWLTGDGRFLFYRQRTGLDTDVFRLGQSWWPDDIAPREPVELLGTWTIQAMPEPMWAARNSGIPLQQQFLWGAWRNTLDDSGDMVMIKGHNGAGRLPYHTFSIMEQRLADRTLLKGYRTQVVTSADGMVEPVVAMDAGLVDHGTLGATLYAVGEVPRMAFANWRRTFVQRAGRYALFVDDLGFRTDSDNMKVETEWNTVGGAWDGARNVLAIQGTGPAAEREGWIQRRALEAEVACGPGTPAELLSDLPSLDIVLLKAHEPGVWMEMPFTLPQPVTGRVYVDLLNYTERGILRISLDGKVLAEGFDHRAPAAIAVAADLGQRTLAAGEHGLRIEVTGPEGAERMYVGLIGVAIRPEGVADAPLQAFELHPSEVMQASGGGVVVMQWLGQAREGEHQVFFHLLAHRDVTHDDALACYGVGRNAAALALPEPALAVTGDFEGISAELAVLAADHLFARALTASPLLRASVPVTVDWDFGAGALNVEATQAAELTVQAAGGARVVRLEPGRHTVADIAPSEGILTSWRGRLEQLLAEGRAERRRQLAAAGGGAPEAPAMVPAIEAAIGGKPVDTVAVPGKDPRGDLIAAAEGSTVHLLVPDGTELRTMTTDGPIRVLRWWAEHDLLLAGCQDDKVIAFGLDGQRRWAFVSEMDQAVWETGKNYWFKSAYPGIHGLHSGVFVGNESQAFVGSATTLEIIDHEGGLIKRMPIFWGPTWKFEIMPRPDGSRDLLIGQWPNGTDNLGVVNSETLTERKSFYGVPPGHTMVGGWTQQNRTAIQFTDVDADGEGELVSVTNGIWNRVTIFSATGTPEYNAQFGPGATSAPYAQMRDAAVADLDGDGDQEIVVGISEGLVVVLDHQCAKVWAKRLPSPPTQLEAVTPAGGELPVIVVGCEDGTVVRLSGSGEIEAVGSAGGRVERLVVAQTPAAPLAVTLSTDGALRGYLID